jgi:uracil-DNA glycosylase family 4
MGNVLTYDRNCRACPRLARFLNNTRAEQPDYYCQPVPAFGDDQPSLLIVGLAPGMHGANRTGRPFTGDYAGVLLYETLFQFGFSSAAVSTDADDGLVLSSCRITNAVKCLPPANKPTTTEIRQCNHFLAEELNLLAEPGLILALGRIAHDAVLRAMNHKLSAFTFAHGAKHRLSEGKLLIDSYHCSRYNTQTRRLTESMFHDIFRDIYKMLKQHRC